MALTLATLIAGCAMEAPPEDDGPVAFEDMRVRYLADDLLEVSVTLEGVPTQIALREVTDCAAVQSANRRDIQFARHVRTSFAEEAGIRRADAVYTLAKTVPRGDFVLDVAVQAETCRELGVTDADG